MLNHIEICGRLCSDPIVRYTKAEKPVASLTLAVDRDGKDAGVDFINCVAWNETAKFAANYFHKGDPAIVSGRLQMRPWEDKNGNKRIEAEVVVDRLYFVPKARSNDAPAFSAPAANDFANLTDADGDLPF